MFGFGKSAKKENWEDFESAVAVLILAIAFGLIWRNPATETANLNLNDVNKTNINVSKESLNVRLVGYFEMKKDAVGDYKHCALKFSLK